MALAVVPSSIARGKCPSRTNPSKFHNSSLQYSACRVLTSPSIISDRTLDHFLRSSGPHKQRFPHHQVLVFATAVSFSGQLTQPHPDCRWGQTRANWCAYTRRKLVFTHGAFNELFTWFGSYLIRMFGPPHAGMAAISIPGRFTPRTVMRLWVPPSGHPCTDI